MAEMPAVSDDLNQDHTADERRSVVILFSGDSGDGMQLTGDQFTNTSAVLGNDVSTFPDFPAEIRAPAGTIPGLSGFQVNFSSFLCPDYHHSSSITTGSMCSSQELLTGGVCGGLGSPWSPFLFQRLLVVFPKLGLQLLSVVKEVHELNLCIDL